MKLHKFIYLTLFVLLISGLASVAYASHSWGGYHWGRTSSPFTLELGDNVSSKWDAYLATTSNDWSASSVLDTVVKSGKTSAKNCKPVSGRVEVCNSKYGNNGWLGIAQIWVSGGHIVQGVVKMNDTYFDTQSYNTPAWRNLVMCQEVGHTLGLGHTDENFGNTPEGTCMDYSSDPVPNQHPNQHDYDMLESIYSHLDSINTFVSTSDDGGDTGTGGGGKGRGKPQITGNIDLENPTSWGKIVREDAKGNPSLYVRDNGDGNEVFTFVTWIDGDNHSH